MAGQIVVDKQSPEKAGVGEQKAVLKIRPEMAFLTVE